MRPFSVNATDVNVVQKNVWFPPEATLQGLITGRTPAHPASIRMAKSLMKSGCLEVTGFSVDYTISGPRGRITHAQLGMLGRSTTGYVVAAPYREGILKPITMERVEVSQDAALVAGSSEQDQRIFAVATAIHQLVIDGKSNT